MATTTLNLLSTANKFRQVAGTVRPSTKTPKPPQPVYGPSSQMSRSQVKGLKR